MTLTELLKTVWLHAPKTKSNFAREHANLMAMAACDGLITTKIATGFYDDRWRISHQGLKRLDLLQGIEDDDEDVLAD